MIPLDLKLHGPDFQNALALLTPELVNSCRNTYRNNINRYPTSTSCAKLTTYRHWPYPIALCDINCSTQRPRESSFIEYPVTADSLQLWMCPSSSSCFYHMYQVFLLPSVSLSNTLESYQIWGINTHSV